MTTDRLKVLTWHTSNNYLYYLSQGNYEIYVPVKAEQRQSPYQKQGTYPLGDNVHEISADMVSHLELDIILFQNEQNYLFDQFKILSEDQRNLPKIFIEHNPPLPHPTNTRHVLNTPDITLVHINDFNSLMWNSNRTPTVVIAPGVTEPAVNYSGHLQRGIVLVNNLASQSRLFGLDIFLEIRKSIPLDLVGVGNGDLGIGEVLPADVPRLLSKYRFLFSPARYTSLDLDICEAMMMGMPVIGMATTELSTIIVNGKSGFVHTDVRYLSEKMKLLLKYPDFAAKLGECGRAVAQCKFNIRRFIREWDQLFNQVINKQGHTYVN